MGVGSDRGGEARDGRCGSAVRLGDVQRPVAADRREPRHRARGVCPVVMIGEGREDRGRI